MQSRRMFYFIFHKLFNPILELAFDVKLSGVCNAMKVAVEQNVTKLTVVSNDI